MDKVEEIAYQVFEHHQCLIDADVGVGKEGELSYHDLWEELRPERKKIFTKFAERLIRQIRALFPDEEERRRQEKGSVLKDVEEWLYLQFGEATNEKRGIYEGYCLQFGLPLR